MADTPEQPNPATPVSEPAQTEESVVVPGSIATSSPVGTMAHPEHSRVAMVLGATVLVLAVAGGAWAYMSFFANPSASVTGGQGSPSPSVAAAQKVSAISLATKNYGDKYASGLLPVGDNHYTTTGPKKGYIYTCNANFVPAGQAGAQVRGPWFTNNNTQWDVNKKTAVAGHVNWTPSLNVTVAGGTRTITTNDLPNHFTGTFPVASSDPAYQYDRNPSTISAQSLAYALAANPTAGSANCVGGEVGVMLTGVALFDGFDAGGRDAGAWEVQDGCDGHPQNKGEYHYHTLSRCVKDTSVSTVIGYALDGFPITGPKVGDKNYLTTSDLDECHGLTSDVMVDGKKVSTYHYVMTQDFPYSVSCFRAKAIQPPGRPETSGQPARSGSPLPPPGGQLPPRQ
jgi:hypothetical protein